MFRCKWYNTDPKGKRLVVDNGLTSVNITSEWYTEEPFILATQAQQVFYLNDWARGKNWMVVQKVNHHNIYDIVERDDEENVSDDVFQEEDSSELPPFNPIEGVDEPFILVREDVEAESVPHAMVLKLRGQEAFLNDHEDNMENIEDYDDEGRVFINDEESFDLENDNDSDDLDVESSDDNIA